MGKRFGQNAERSIHQNESLSAIFRVVLCNVSIDHGIE